MTHTPPTGPGTAPDEALPRPRAILLLGPTGSGKTPLGEALAVRGIAGTPCRHFDFGAQLREAAAGRMPDLSASFVTTIRAALAARALLRDDQFPIAHAILADFLRAQPPASWLVLNGLPRHAGQARDLEPHVAVRHVVELVCDTATVAQRIRIDAGGDRGQRVDDAPADIEAKLAWYQKETAPLVEGYAARGAAIHRLRVTVETAAPDLARGVAAALGHASAL